MKTREILFIGAMIIPTVLMGVFGFWPLFWVFVIFDVIFGLTEWHYVRTTGKTISQHFWMESLQHKTQAIIILIAMALMWIALIYHLGYKMFR